MSSSTTRTAVGSPNDDSHSWLKIVAGATSDDLKKRREIKFALKYPDLGAIRQILLGGCKRIVHRSAVSRVRSIYFDDCRLSAYQENLAGLSRRRKARIRWYDDELPDSDFYVEEKWRSNLITGKHRFKIISKRPLGSVLFHELVRQLSAVLPDSIGSLLTFRPEPIVLVEYSREHFVSHDGVARATLDYDLVVFDQRHANRPSVHFGLPVGEFAVLEVKVPVGSESALGQILSPLKIRPTRSSKYVLACESLGIIDGCTRVSI